MNTTTTTTDNAQGLMTESNEQCARAWRKVVNALDRVSPGWSDDVSRPSDCAVRAIEALTTHPPQQERATSKLLAFADGIEAVSKSVTDENDGWTLRHIATELRKFAAPAAPATPEPLDRARETSRRQSAVETLLAEGRVWNQDSGWSATPESAEPVAWIFEERYGHNDDAWIERIRRQLPVWEHRKSVPLYTHPTPSASNPFPKEWCMRMAEREGDADVTAGTYPPNKTLTLDLRDDEAKHADSHVCVVVNNNQPGSQHIVETAPNTTLPVGTKLYARPAASDGGLREAARDLLNALSRSAYTTDGMRFYASKLHEALATPPTEPETRESQMVIVERAPDGTPTVWCDPEIVDLVTALNTGKLTTVASCSGHGKRPGRITLGDGRELFVLAGFNDAAALDRLFPIDINGEPVAAPAQVTDAEVEAMCDAFDAVAGSRHCIYGADAMRDAGNALLAMRSPPVAAGLETGQGVVHTLQDAYLAREADTKPDAAGVVARPLDEWHEDTGCVIWWAFEDGEFLGEPAWIGRPDDSDWPGYHTHWTEHPQFPAGIAAQQAPATDDARWVPVHEDLARRRAEAQQQQGAKAESVAAPEGLTQRIEAAIQRIVDGHAPRRIPADPTDVDLVLAEVLAWVNGQWPPFWLKSTGAIAGQHKGDRP